METAEITLEGYNFIGRFRIEDGTYRTQEWVDSEVGRHPETVIRGHYHGEGMIWLRGKEEDTQRFLIHPKGLEKSNLVIWGEKAKAFFKEDEKAAIDLTLRNMYEQSLKSKEIIPKIQPVCLDNLLS